MSTLRDPATLAGFIDHTILKPDATRADVARLCEEARQYGFASVCVNPVHVAFVADHLAGSPVRTCGPTCAHSASESNCGASAAGASMRSAGQPASISAAVVPGPGDHALVVIAASAGAACARG